jgi:GNAT superfamily N-acetyltransferase
LHHARSRGADRRSGEPFGEARVVPNEGDLMSIVVSLENDPSRKREIQQQLTALLPEWFGRAEANFHYARQAEVLAGYVARMGGEAKGMLLLKTCSLISAEIYWMGVQPHCHRSGIGRALIEAACEALRAHGVKFLFASTLHPSERYEPYRRTRRFYEAMGFEYVLEEQFPAGGSPLGYYMKQIAYIRCPNK